MAVGLKNARQAFTIVELLVVISIIGMLMALLLPAVQQAREAGRSNTCRNNLRNCTLAVLNFESAKRQYPGWRQPLNVTLPGDSSPTQIPVSWVVVVLPYLERNDLYALWRNPQGSVTAGINWPPQVYIDVLNCPSSPPTTTDNSPCAYVTNGGMADVVVIGGNGPVAPNPSDWRANGMFFNHSVQLPGAVPPSPFCSSPNREPLTVTSQDYVAANDGSSLTLMLSENNNVPAFAAPFVAPSGLSGGPVSWGNPATAAYEKQGNFIWWPDKSPDPAVKINAPDGHSSSSAYYYYFLHPASAHPGGVNASSPAA